MWCEQVLKYGCCYLGFGSQIQNRPHIVLPGYAGLEDDQMAWSLSFVLYILHIYTKATHMPLFPERYFWIFNMPHFLENPVALQPALLSTMKSFQPLCFPTWRGTFHRATSSGHLGWYLCPSAMLISSFFDLPYTAIQFPQAWYGITRSLSTLSMIEPKHRFHHHFNYIILTHYCLFRKIHSILSSMESSVSNHHWNQDPCSPLWKNKRKAPGSTPGEELVVFVGILKLWPQRDIKQWRGWG